ncbi:camphor resistance protein CrcB [Corynebacterium liangguodongii]|uniref:Fluoride-specific ion channel n=1 Tax=Corynebacterium liangguodongii TaxID=2079535 RepID=A0A2S0WH91_9CORY|nr:camphor resistance protein CrcB [Corynebacterium liangguodongii]PWB98818.1 camphor resistance protein CrcB [Corynebacterium liangguodongii]
MGAGAALGALVRFVTLHTALFLSVDPLLTIFAINIAGCIAMGLYAPGKLWGTGFLGGLTTFSALSPAGMPLTPGLAVGFLAACTACGVAGWLLGDFLRGNDTADGTP